MKRFAIICLSIIAAFLSSCAIFILDDDEQKRKDHEDSISITITHTDGEDQRK